MRAPFIKLIFLSLVKGFGINVVKKVMIPDLIEYGRN